MARYSLTLRLANGLTRPGFTCTIDGLVAPVEYAGATPEYKGAYQVNIRVPSLRTSNATLTCGWDADTQASTNVWLAHSDALL